MAESKVFSALKTTTINNMVLDAGVIVYDVNSSEIEALNNVSAIQKLITSKGLGATKGGASFTAVPEMRNLFDGIDGARGAYKDATVIDSWETTLKTTVSEFTAKNIERAANATSVKANSYDGITPEVGMIASEKFKNIAWIGPQAGKEKPMAILLENALNINGINVVAEDKNTGSIELEFKAHFTLANPEQVPFVIYAPK